MGITVSGKATITTGDGRAWQVETSKGSVRITMPDGMLVSLGQAREGELRLGVDRHMTVDGMWPYPAKPDKGKGAWTGVTLLERENAVALTEAEVEAA